VYQLALRGDSGSRRLWNDYAAEVPQEARLVIADVQTDSVKAVKATKAVDKVLGKAEKPKAKKTKNLSALKSGNSKAEIREHEAYLRSLLSSDDPSIREGARKTLGL
jgi:hypothetical protein